MTQVPAAALERFAFVDDPRRRPYAAMVAYLDTWVDTVARALHAAGLWEDLVWVVSADNGGPIYVGGGGNNHPLRGGKHSNWEGGVRANAFVTGGHVPAPARGTVAKGLAAVCDVYTTFCALAGADPADDAAAAAGLPPVDGVDLWPWVVGDVPASPRGAVVLGATLPEITGLPVGWDRGRGATVVQGVIRADGWKLLIGRLEWPFWQGPLYPNASSATLIWDPVDCGFPCGEPDPAATAYAAQAHPQSPKNGCLFNVFDDPTEHRDVAPAQPDTVRALCDLLTAAQATVFSPDRGGDGGQACAVALTTWRGFYGPFVDVGQT